MSNRIYRVLTIDQSAPRVNRKIARHNQWSPRQQDMQVSRQPLARCDDTKTVELSRQSIGHGNPNRGRPINSQQCWRKGVGWGGALIVHQATIAVAMVVLLKTDWTEGSRLSCHDSKRNRTAAGKKINMIAVN